MHVSGQLGAVVWVVILNNVHVACVFTLRHTFNKIKAFQLLTCMKEVEVPHSPLLAVTELRNIRRSQLVTMFKG